MPIFQSPKVFLLSTFCGQTPMDSVYSQTQKEQQQQQQNHYQPQPQPQPQILNKQNPNKQKRLTQEQVRVLEKSFSDNKKLVPELKLELASQLGLPPRQVAVWYQNKRARWKAQSLELDHSTLQMKLDSTAAEKRRLQREVARLSNELTKAHEMVLALMMNSSSSTSCHVGSGPPPPSDFDPASRLMNIDAKNNNNNSCSSSSDQWGSSGLNFNNGDYEVLQVDDDDDDEMDASFMMGGGGGTSASTCSWD